VNDQDLEQLLNRYRPAGPADDLLPRIITSPDRQLRKSPRAWPWAVAAAALLAVTMALHVSAFVPSPERTSTAQADLAQQLGGDPLADRTAQFILASQVARDASEDQTPWDTR